jgi:hypothetical protein
MQAVDVRFVDLEHIVLSAIFDEIVGAIRIQVPIENDKLTTGETGILFKGALSVAKAWAQPGASVYATVPS